ncbi:MAG TPA: hypothetical protein VGH28_12605 [Polyangiaceae bacterium]|jgi:hypothetical protein
MLDVRCVGLAGAVLLAACSGSPGTGDDDSGPADASSIDSGSNDTGAKNEAGPSDAAPIESGDGFGAARTACLNEINKLRATQGHAPYALWTGDAIDQCVDEQATNDETDDSPHEAWLAGKYPTCNGNGQDECLGYGVSASAVVKCLDSMWAEKDQPNCAGCPACSGAYDPNCTNCDFYGQSGQECGHYVNMSADYFAKVACGFSALGGWATQNFSP